MQLGTAVFNERVQGRFPNALKLAICTHFVKAVLVKAERLSDTIVLSRRARKKALGMHTLFGLCVIKGKF